MSTEFLTHNKIQLALHLLRVGEGQPLLLLHGLGERTPAVAPTWTHSWAGPVYGLDFTGHGATTVPMGGGYSAETMLADTDIALAHLGPCTIVGRGLGAYVALMIAGARPQLVRGAVLCDGPGLWGGATGPTSSSFHSVDPPYGAPDPNALIDLSRDLRPPDYASLFVRLALEHSGLAEPITVTAVVRPPWLAAVAGEVGVATGTLAEALALYTP
ncbi:MAG TPA: alpha/beta hydrolase [Ilumatobacteraceae bacterium]|nr:alpha/beta hydrolase [Ilumatobacteraceae bacterium]HQZ86709.1 alpha/beta hydrolase [Actinomycetota bacterium]